jgi:hypothetical protein
MNRSFLVVSIILLQLICSSQQLNWSSFIDSVSTLSSPRCTDLNLDGIKDIVVGSGTDSTYSNNGVIAFDGSDGSVIWNVPVTDEIFTSAIFNDINNDLIPDVFIGGRNAQFYAIDGSNGAIIWEAFPQNIGLNPSDSGWYNFYSGQLVDDQNGDNIKDILVANGGDHKAAPWDPRTTGYLMILDGFNGNVIAKAPCADSAETYCSPLIVDHGISSSPLIVYGTGGEHQGGNMYVTNLSDLLNNDISMSISIASDSSRGFIAPPSVADLNQDNYKDIIVQSFGGVISATDGLSLQPMWSKSISGCESSSAPIIGNFYGGDMNPDVFAVVYKGQTPSYFEYYQLMIDGISGEVKWLDSIGDMHFSSANALDVNGDGRDEVLVSLNNHVGYFEHEMFLIDFQNDSVSSIISSIAGVNLASTPLVEDIDNDGLVEIVYTYKADSTNPGAWNGFYINSFATNIPIPNSGIAWGSYMGTYSNGQYNTELNYCATNNMVSSWNITHPSCNHEADGSVYPLSFGSNSPLTYLWSNSAIGDTLFNATAGSYKVFTTDSLKCIEMYNVQLNDPYFISFGNIVHNTCFGDSSGSATVLSTGCTCQFSGCLYDWSNGNVVKYGTNLTAGMWEVSITHTDGCVVVDSVYINDGIPIIDSSFVIDSDCYYENSGAINLFPLDSASTFYNWSNGFTTSTINQLLPGNYSVEVSNVNCFDSLFFTINSPDTVSFNSIISPISCHNFSNGSISIIVNGGLSPYLYHSDSSFSTQSTLDSLSNGTYSIYITDIIGCSSDTSDISLIQPSEINLNFTTFPESDSGNYDGSASVSISGGTPPYSVLWNNGQTDSTIVYLEMGLYSVTVTDANGCSISDSVFVESLVGIDENINSNELYVFPNPSKGIFSLMLNKQVPYDVFVFDMAGRELFSKLNCFSNSTFQSKLSSGNYILRVYVGGSVINLNLYIID